MTRVSLYSWGARLSVAAAIALGGCSGGSGSSGDQGRVTGTPGAGGSPQAGMGGATGGPAAAPGSTIFVSTFSKLPFGPDFTAMAADEAGNFYIAGFTFLPLPNPADTTSGTPAELFVNKYSPTGELLWSQPIPLDLSNPVSLSSITVQPTTGAVILAGNFFGTTTLAGQTITSSTNAENGFPSTNVVLVALDSAGYFVWVRTYPSTALVSPTQVFSTASGDIELMGIASNNATVGGAPFCCSGSTSELTIPWVARYSPVGDPMWSFPITGDFGMSYAGANANGDIAIGGGVHGTATYRGTTFSGGNASVQGGFNNQGTVLRIDGQGNEVWVKLLQGGGTFSEVNATIDAAGNVPLFGGFDQSLDFGDGVTLSAASANNQVFDAGYLARLAPDGTAQWAVAFPSGSGTNEVFPEVITTDPAGNIAFAGEISGGLAVGGPPTAPDDLRFVAKFGPDGTFRWSRGFTIDTNPTSSHTIGIAADPWGQIGFGGTFNKTVDFGTGPITPPGTLPPPNPKFPSGLPPDIFLVKLAP
jgi:hypothetical protein